VKTGRVGRDRARFYRQLCEAREKGDYRDLATFEPGEVEAWLGEASAFVDEIAQLVAPNLEA
jgi:uncharacterized protein (UPF0332 family)